MGNCLSTPNQTEGKKKMHKIIIATLSTIEKCGCNWWMGDKSVVSSYNGILSDH